MGSLLPRIQRRERKSHERATRALYGLRVDALCVPFKRLEEGSLRVSRGLIENRTSEELPRYNGLALLAEAVAAVDGPVAARFEGYLGILTALGADDRVHFAGSATATATAVATATAAAATAASGFLGSATRRAALGFVREPELVVTFLFSGREDEAAAALNAAQILVCEFHMLPALGKTVKMPPRTIGENQAY